MRVGVVTELQRRQAAGAENLPGVQLGNKRSARTSRSLSLPAASSPPAALSPPARRARRLNLPAAPALPAPAPQPGEHTAAILAELGVTEDECARLRAAGAVS